MAEWLTLRRVALVTLTVAVTLTALRALTQVAGALALIFLSLLFATAIKPPVVALQRRGIPRAGAIIGVYLAALGVVVLVGLLVLPPLIREAATLVQNAPVYYQRIVQALTTSDNPLIQQLNQQLLSQPLTDWATSNAARLAAELGSRLLNLSTAIAGLLFALVTMLTVGFYWIHEQGHIERTWFSIMPATSRPRLLLTWRRIEERLGAYLRGLVILCVTVGSLCGLGYGLIGLRYALVLGVIAGLLEAIPTIGVLITAVIVTLVALPQSLAHAGLALGVTLIVQQVENTLLVPRVMGQAIGVSPLTLIIFLLVFGTLLGPSGALLAVPLAAIVQIVVDEWVINDPAVADLAVETRSANVARLRLLELRSHLRRRLRSSDAPLGLDTGADAALQRLELAVERAMRALPPADSADVPDAALEAAWASAAVELAEVRRLLAQVDRTRPPDPQVHDALQHLDALLSEAHLRTAEVGHA